jgi:hypothetical protein
MRIFVSEADKTDGKALYEVLLKTLRDEKIAGATVLRGIAGFGTKSHLHKANILSLSQNLPIVIEVIDTQDNIDRVLGKIEEILPEGLVTLEKVRVLKYKS